MDGIVLPDILLDIMWEFEYVSNVVGENHVV